MKATELLEGLKKDILKLSAYEGCGVVVNSISAEEILNAAIEAHKYDLVVSVPELYAEEGYRCDYGCPVHQWDTDEKACSVKLDKNNGKFSYDDVYPGPGCPRYETKNTGEAG